MAGLRGSNRRARVSGLVFKPGPATAHTFGPPVGGEVLAPDPLAIFLTGYGGLLLLVLTLPVALVLFRRRRAVLRLVASVFGRLSI